MNGLIILNTIVSSLLTLAFLALFVKKNNVRPNRILALIIINPAINFVANILNLYGIAQEHLIFYYFSIVNALFFAPLVYFYVIIMMGKKFNWKNPVLYLTVLTIFFYIYTIIGLEMNGKEAVNAFFKGLKDGPYPKEMELMDTIFISLQQIYFTMAIVQYLKYKGKINHVFSNFNNTKERFIFYFIIFIWTLNLTTIALYATLPFYTVQYVYLPLVLLAIFSFIFIAAFNFQSVFSLEEYDQFVSKNKVINESLEEKNNTDQDVQNERLISIHEKIIEKMDQKHYTNPDLNVKLLAELINEPVYLVSKCLNTSIQKTFFEFINEYRISAFEETSNSNPHLTIEGIALEVGFSNRASFYRIYKKMTGKTPTELLNKK